LDQKREGGKKKKKRSQGFQEGTFGGKIQEGGKGGIGKREKGGKKRLGSLPLGENCKIKKKSGGLEIKPRNSNAPNRTTQEFPQL